MEYSKDAVETALKLSLQPPPDSKVVMQVIRRRLLKERGFDMDNFTLEEVCIKICKMIDDLRSKSGSMQAQLDLLSQKKLTHKQLISALIKTKIFTDNQEKLLRALSSCEPTKETEIIRIMNIPRWNKTNLKALIKDIKKRIKQWGGEANVKIIPLHGNPFNGYQLVLNHPLLKTSYK